MNRLWTKETRRKLAVIICAALIFTGVFQNFVRAETDAQDTDYRIYLNNIRVEVENGDQQEFEKSVSGNDIVIDGKPFQIGQYGQIVDAYGAATVSGNDMYITAHAPQVEIRYDGDQTYFEATGTVRGKEGANVFLARKHTLGAEIFIEVEKGGMVPAASVYPGAHPQFYYTNQLGQPVEPQAVRASEAPFRVRTEFWGIEASADAVLDEKVKLVYRGYAEYGRDLQLWDRDGNKIDQIEQGIYYNVGKIVIPGYEKTPDNPFDGYELAIGGVITADKLSKEPVTINVPSVSNGDAALTLHIGNAGDGNLENRTIRFLVDNTKPVVTKVSYKRSGDTEYTEWTEGTALKDTDGISMRFNISEAHGLKEVKIVCRDENGRTIQKEIELASEQTGIGTEYVYEWAGSAPDVYYTEVGLTAVDMAGNTATWGSASYLLDHTAPQVSRITWEKAEEPGVIRELSPMKESTINAREGITLVYHVAEASDMGMAVLRYVDGDGEEVILPGEQKRETGAYTGYTFTYQLVGENEIYKDLQLFLEDELGNVSETPAAKLTAILDHTPPAIEKISWTTDKQAGAVEIKGPQVLVDDTKIKLIVDIEEENLEKIGLYYVENGREKLIEEQSNGRNFVFMVDTQTYNYKPLFFRVADKSGNLSCYGQGSNQSLMVIIDPDAPEMKELTYTYPQEGSWYRKQREPLQYSFTLKDYSEIKSIRMITRGEDGMEVCWDLTQDCKRISGRDEKGYYHYRVTTKDNRFATASDQNQQYYFVIEDRWGNELSTVSDTQNMVNMRVDNTAPSSVAYLKFSGDLDRAYNGQDEPTQVKDKQYQYGKFSGKLFNNSYVDITVYVADLAAEDALDQAASGIKEVKVIYRYTERSLFADKEKVGVVTYSEGNTENKIKTASIVKTDDGSMVMDEIRFRLSVKNGVRISSIESIEITDAAGNKTVIREYGDANELAVDYIVDSNAPELSHIIPNGSGYSKDANTYYYNTNRLELAVSIAENNFYPQEVVSNLKAAEANRTITMSSFRDMGGYNYRSDYEMKDGDGRYQFTLSYADRSGNDLIFRDGGSKFVKDGTYTSPVLVLDTTPPVLTIDYYHNGENISDSVYGGKCVNGDVTAVINVTDVNFDADQVEIGFYAMDAVDNQGFGIDYNPSGWSQNGDTYTYAIPCNTEGHYSLTARCVDKAGNHSNGVAASDFTVDKTIPAVNIAYDTTTDNGYYNVDRVATVTVTDQNFDESAVEYVITTTGEQPAVGNWVHTAANGCNGKVHVKECKWSCSVVFGSDADYSFTFQCMDEAGNVSEGIEAEEFVIDQTQPVIQVSYDNNEALNGFYFKESRNAVVTITEHNFNSSDVNMTVSSPDGELHSPSLWRSSGPDVYVCEISYDADGDYTFDIAYTDLAGNAAQDYDGDRFIIDLTAPELDIGGVYDKSANNGVVAPIITYTDKNYDADMIEVSIVGAHHGKMELEYSTTAEQSGQTISFVDFSHEQEMDDLYTLEAAVTDKAGNTTEKSIVFSVNRFGSVYVFSEDTQSVLEQFYVNQGPRLLVTEINVDTLEHQEISYSCDGNITVLKENEDYIVQESGNELEWKEYLYDISGSNFDSEGVYVVTIQSIDRAANDMTNRLKEKSIEFTVDKTSPSVVTGGIEDGGSYAETARSLTIDAVDNIYLTGLEIYLNAELVASYDESVLAESYGVVSYEVKELGNTQTVYVIAKDAAGNVTQTQPINFLISSNAFIRWYYNKPLFIGSIVGVIMAVGGVSGLIFWRRGRKEKR